MTRSLLLVLILLVPGMARAEYALPELKPADQQRIRNLAASRERALALAASGDPAELRTVKELLAAPALPLAAPPAIAGNWRCRSIQLGGISPLTTNPFFECRIVLAGNQSFLEKVTGSVRRKARLMGSDEKSLLMFGSYWATSDKATPYGVDDYRDEVGILERIGPDRLRVELPEPRAFNSARHEIIELVRKR